MSRNLSVVKSSTTYEEVLKEYLQNLTEEERHTIVNGVVVMGVNGIGDYTKSFYSVVKAIPTLTTLGLLEELKYFLIMNQGE